MGRSQSAQISQQSEQNSEQNQGNAQEALGATNKSLQDYSSNLNKFMNFGRQTYGANGEYMKDQNAIATTTAAGGANATKGDLALNSMRTGENTASYAPAVAEAQRQNEQGVTSQLANADSSRLDKLTAINQYGVQASSLPASVQAGLYGTSLGGSNAAMGTAASASAASPGFFDVFGQDLAQGAGAVAAGLCPCEGSMIRLANDDVLPVELLTKGMKVRQIGWTRPPNTITEEIVPVLQRCVEVKSAQGKVHRCSESHTFALASGGYVHAKDALNEVVLVIDLSGTDIITSVTDIGEQLVYPMAVDGSHCYAADGFWILA